MTRTSLILAFSAVALGACVAVAPTRQTLIQQQQPSPQEIVAARQAAFHMSGAAMGNIKAAIDRGGDPKSQAYAARGVARWARVLPTMFPENTAAIAPSRARPEIWANKADFNAKAAAFAAAATELAAAADSGDKEAFAARWRAAGATCGACHQLYQVPQP
ncbi:MAG TPA: cytochrome c [Allosphingosinicella sp.]|jgi:cytochrome c556